MSETITLPSRGYYQRNDKSPEIIKIQTELKKQGLWDSTPFNQNYGPKTEKFVREFQAKNGLGVDGKFGKSSLKALMGGAAEKESNSEASKPTPAPAPTPKTNVDGEITHDYTGTKGQNVDILIAEAKHQSITNPYSIVGMLCVVGKESGYIPKEENMNYSKERLPEVWSRFSKTGKRVPKGEGKNNYNDLAVKCANNPENLANLVYGGLYGNGPESSGDGYKYRGRGFNQITFKGTYKKYAGLIGVDILNNPNDLNEPKVAAAAAIKFLLNRFKERNIDPNNFSSVQAALEKFAGANAGWGKDPSWAIKNSEKYKPHFKVNVS